MLRRRCFINLVVGLAAWPVAAAPQQRSEPLIPQDSASKESSSNESSSKESSPDPLLARVMEAINAKLKYPQSARYGQMVRRVGPNVNGKPAEVVCGSVDAKDASGGYGRKRSFVYFTGDGATFLVEANPHPEDVAQIIYGRFCK